MIKNTGELINQLKKGKDINAFLIENENSFVEKPLTQYLNELLEKYKTRKADVICKSGLATVYGYQIFDGRRNPKRDKVLQIAIGFGLSLEDTQKLLRKAGYNELYPRNRRDVLFIYAINSGLSLEEVEQLLFHMGERSLEDIKPNLK